MAIKIWDRNIKEEDYKICMTLKQGADIIGTLGLLRFKLRGTEYNDASEKLIGYVIDILQAAKLKEIK